MHLNQFSNHQENQLLAYLTSRLNPRLRNYKHLILNSLPLGQIDPKFQTLIAEDLSKIIIADAQSIQIKLSNWQMIGETLQNLAFDWYKRNIYAGWRNEKFDVCHQLNIPLFQLERSAFRPFGFKSHAVHLNAWLLNHNGLIEHWIAKRSPNKAVSPNKLDNIACGGIISGESPFESIIRESFEEANITQKHIQQLSPATSYYSFRKVHRGIHREFLHIFNLSINPNFKPYNRDGEVACFQKMNNHEILEAILKEEFMLDSVISLLDLWFKLKCINTNGRLALWLISLQQSLESGLT